MKKKLGPKTYFYPMTTTIVGATVKGNANFCTIAFIGIVNYEPAMIAFGINSAHYTFNGIKENKTFSVNIPNENQVKITDYVGLTSGKKIEKKELFDVFYGDLKTAPLIAEFPLSLECKVRDILEYGGIDKVVIGDIMQVYADEEILGDKDIPNMSKIKPILFSMYENTYYNIGEKIGNAWSAGKKFKKSIKN
jgi:flavin reductase (DIM6/NTAB) family NADH-FMN oxidoreductase RutF